MVVGLELLTYRDRGLEPCGPMQVWLGQHSPMTGTSLLPLSSQHSVWLLCPPVTGTPNMPLLMPGQTW